MRADLAARLGQIRWNLHPLWGLAPRVDHKNDGLVESNLLSLSYGQVVRKDINEIGGLRPDSYETYNIIAPGDTVLRMTDLQNDQRSIRTGLATERGIITSAYITVRPDGDKVEPRFLHSVLRAYDIKKTFYEMGVGVRQTLKYAELADLPIPLPPRDTQRAIADYLDRETGEIDAMLAKLTSLSELVRERRREIVRLVLKSVGQTVRLGLVVDVVSGSGFPDKFQGVPDEELPFYKVSSLSNMDRQVLTDSGNTVSREIADQLGARVIPSQSVVMAKIGAALLLARYALTSRPSCIDNNMQALVPHRDVIVSRFLAYAMEGVSIPSLVKPGPVPSLDVMGMKMSRIAYNPSLKEQCRIADHLDEVTGRIDAMLTKIDELKALLVERRATLITDVITGRKKVA